VEDHAVTFAAGLAHAGMRPVVAIYSTFMQRAVDQVIHDVALSNLPVVFAVDRAGLVTGDGPTHQGIFDIGLFGGVPNLALFAPSSRGELAAGLRWALAHDGPTMIRYPKAVCGPELPELAAPLEPGRGAFVRFHHGEVLLVSVGALLPGVLAAARELDLAGIAADIYAMRFIAPLDAGHLLSVLRMYTRIVVAEEAAPRGGVGERICALLLSAGFTGIAVRCLNVGEGFPGIGTRDQLLSKAGLDGPGIARSARAACESPASTVSLPGLA
jgi:1-deoxy-D-xylulose-5-phosphate synthase